MRIWIKLMIKNDKSGLLYQSVIDRHFTYIARTPFNLIPYLKSQIVMHKIENVDLSLLTDLGNLQGTHVRASLSQD